MLILNRQFNESIIINDDIKIIVLGNNRKEVRIGISAPEKVKVYREEIYKKIQQEKKAILAELSDEEEIVPTATES